MKLLVEIPEDYYNKIMGIKPVHYTARIYIAVQNGQPIPDDCEILTREAYEDLCKRAGGLRGDTDA